jgi:hypothetical protein
MICIGKANWNIICRLPQTEIVQWMSCTIFYQNRGGAMIKAARHISILFLLLVIFCVSSFCSNMNICCAQEIPESIIIEHDIHRLDMFGPVHFGHQQHIETGILCKKCHHDWNEYSYDLPMSCINCHGRDRVRDVVSLRTAYMKQCLGCHIILDPDGEKTGPTICTSCHQYKR